MPQNGSHLIGWKEYIDLPDWGIRHVKAKIDTGARTSAIHVEGCRRYEDAQGRPMAELRLSLHRKQPGRVAVVHARVLRTVVVTDSGGHKEERPVVATRIALGPVVKRISFTVTNRAGMLFRILLGRKALEGDFVVDVSRKYLMRRG